ncbi:MAG: alpha/beta fold hydrolase [Pseudomonadota bacterium]
MPNARPHHLLAAAALGLMSTLAVANDALGLPTGLVNADCDPQSKQTPIVLIHGTFASTRRAFSTLAPALKADGHCLFAINYGRMSPLSPHGMTDINQSALQIGDFVQTVLARTGATKVTLIGHSQGGLLAFMIARSAPLAGKVDRLVALAPSLNGTTRVPAGMSMKHCPACAQQSDQSAFLQAFHQEKVNPPGVRSLILATRQDLVVTPVERQFLDEPDVTNILLQDKYPKAVATHSGLLHEAGTLTLVREFLEQP